MNLNSHRKEIIKQIVTGKVYDIYSYLEAFGYLEEYKINVDETINKFEEDEKDITYKIPNYEGEFEKKRIKGLHSHEKPDYTENDFLYVKAGYSIDTPGSIVSFNNKKYEYFFANKEIKVAREYSYILEFVTLWQQLKEKGLIFEITKEVVEEDIAIFYEIFPTKETKYYKDLISKREKVILPSKFPKKYTRLPTYDCYEDLKEYGVSEEYLWNEKGFIEKSLLPYYEKYPVFNEIHLTTCKEFVDKKIVATPLLGEYVANNYQTAEEKKSKWALIGTWVAIGISAVMALFSIWTAFRIDPSNDNLTKIQSQLEQIQDEINNSNDQQLDEILSELKEIELLQSRDNNTELLEKLDSVTYAINEIKMNNSKEK